MSWYMHQKSWNEGNVYTVCIQMALKQQRSWHAFKWCCEIVKLWIYERWRRLAVKWEKTSGGAFCIPAFEAVSCKGGGGLSIYVFCSRRIKEKLEGSDDMDGCSLESESSVDHKSFLRMPEVLWLLYFLNFVYFDYIKFHVLKRKKLWQCIRQIVTIHQNLSKPVKVNLFQDKGGSPQKKNLYFQVSADIFFEFLSPS